MTATGHLTADPNLRFGGGGRAFANFRIACSHRYKRNDEWVEETTFLDCAAHGSLAENIANSARKGSRLVVMGRLQQREWDDDNGNNHKVLELVCDDAGPSLRWATAVVEKNPRREQ